ncbi:cupin domain-containing protein [Humitalea sp. 24SJ18S-53]|uniref:cupin domain-containing protein n=1 Tax=Humitalea sp. 24SJ18S-53 TaxID=3422307 RepID=UPI003D67AECE
MTPRAKGGANATQNSEHDAMTMTLAEEAAALAFPGLDEDAIIALREARDWCHLRSHTSPDRFAHLVSIADIDALLRTDAARAGRIAVADSAREGSAAVPEEDWSFDDGRVDLPRLFDRFDQGGTLIVSELHELHPPLARFCRGLEKLFLHGVQCNIYLTPPGAQGFRAHFDTHDVLVMQVSGQKDWRVWNGQPVPDPTRRVRWDNQVEPMGEPIAVPMRPGDILYLPRGVMHDAATQPGGEPSLHATIGLLEPSWAEALRRIIDTAEEQDPAFRAAVPTWRIGQDGFGAGLADLVARLAAPGLVETLALTLIGRLAEDRLQMPARGLIAPPPAPDQRLRLADSMHSAVVPLPDGGGALRYGGGKIIMTEAEFGWLMSLEDGAAAADLPGDALAFLQRLFALGLLEAV